MSYQTTFRLKKELDSQFKSWMKSVSQSELTKYKVILEGTCMLPVKEDNSVYSTYLHKCYDLVHSAISMYVKYLSESWKIGLTHRIDENNEIFFCGWQYSNNDVSPWESEDAIIDFYTEELFLYTIQATKGAFDYENTDYQDKLQKVADVVNSIEESVYDMWNQKFVERYRDSEDADESDGYKHKFPEEPEEDED